MRIFTVKEDELTHYWGDVTDIFKDYIGNIVKSAKILLITDYSVEDITVTKDDARREAEKIEKYYSKNKVLLSDATRVIVTFKNNKSIEFRNSEWGSVRKSEE